MHNPNSFMKKLLGFFYKQSTENITIIGKYDTIEGHVEVSKLYVDGTIKSKKPLTVTQLVVSSSGNMEANITAEDSIDVYGIVLGTITAPKVTIHKGAVVQGHIFYSHSFSVDEHSRFMGTVKKLTE